MGNGKIKVAIIGPGNIGTDLMYKLIRSPHMKLTTVIGVVESEGLKRAQSLGICTTTNGIQFVEANPDIADIFFDATTAKAHTEVNAPVLDRLGKITIDLTPAAVGKMVTPLINLQDVLQTRNVNLVTCSGQATIPIVYAISRVTGIKYAEVVTSVASKSAGPGMRENIDEFTCITAKALMQLGGARKAKVLIIFNPAKPEISMRNTIYCIPEGEIDIKAVEESVRKMISRIQKYVPGYALTLSPQYDQGIITTIISVKGVGDFFPSYAGNLDIETSFAVTVGEYYAQYKLAGGSKA